MMVYICIVLTLIFFALAVINDKLRILVQLERMRYLDPERFRGRPFRGDDR